MSPIHGSTDPQAGGDRYAAAAQERRTFARRIDCADSRGMRASYAPARGGEPREPDRWERARREHG
ncbi:MAG TPA: hypothetical protein VFQ45_22230 [Longimicrobium sp.]|nr:hypothetical protein [Longimicrobium sp.]